MAPFASFFSRSVAALFARPSSRRDPSYAYAPLRDRPSVESFTSSPDSSIMERKGGLSKAVVRLHALCLYFAIGSFVWGLGFRSISLLPGMNSIG
jgi:hypothetical protein